MAVTVSSFLVLVYNVKLLRRIEFALFFLFAFLGLLIYEIFCMAFWNFFALDLSSSINYVRLAKLKFKGIEVLQLLVNSAADKILAISCVLADRGISCCIASSSSVFIGDDYRLTEYSLRLELDFDVVILVFFTAVFAVFLFLC